MVVCWCQLQHANACFCQELRDTEPLVSQLQDMLEKQRSLLALCQNVDPGEMHFIGYSLLMFTYSTIASLLVCADNS